MSAAEDTVTQPQPAEPASQKPPLTIYDLLARRYPAPEWAFMREVAPNGGGGIRYADAVAVNTWHSRGYAVHGFEVKVSRSDWLRELKQPEKTERSVFRYCDFWWIVALPGIVKDGELPPTWGLIERRAESLVQRINAPRLEPQPVSRAFFGSLARRLYESVEDRAREMVSTVIAEAQSQSDARVAREVERRTHHHARLEQSVREFEEDTGLTIRGWSGPAARTIRIAKRLEELAGFGVSDGSLGKLSHLASELEKAAASVRQAVEESGLGSSTEPSA